MTQPEAMNIKCPTCGVHIELEISRIGALCHCKMCHNNFIAPSTPIVAGAVLDDFWMQKKLGGSRRSEVFLAKRLSNNNRVVVKVFSPIFHIDPRQISTYVSLFTPEILRTAPALVPWSEGGHSQNFSYLVAPLLSAEDMHEHLRRVGTLHESRLVEIALTCANTLGPLWQSLRLAHGHLKLSNVVIVNLNETMLTDFAIGTLIASGGSMRRDPDLLAYMSPEQSKTGECNDHTDMYSLGAMLFHLATGAKPMPAQEALSLVDSPQEALFPPANQINPNISEEFSGVLQHLLASQPEARPRSWEAFIGTMNEYQKSLVSTQIIRVQHDTPPAKEEAPAEAPAPENMQKMRNVEKRAMAAVESARSNNRDKAPRWLAPVLVVALLVLLLAFGSIALYHSRQDQTTKAKQQELTTEVVNAQLEALQKDYREALLYMSRNPSDYSGQIKRFEEIRTRGVNTEYQQLAHQQIQNLRKMRKEKDEAPPQPQPQPQPIP